MVEVDSSQRYKHSYQPMLAATSIFSFSREILLYKTSFKANEVRSGEKRAGRERLGRFESLCREACVVSIMGKSCGYGFFSRAAEIWKEPGSARPFRDCPAGSLIVKQGRGWRSWRGRIRRLRLGRIQEQVVGGRNCNRVLLGMPTTMENLLVEVDVLRL